MNTNQEVAAREIAINLSTGEFSSVETPLVFDIVKAAMPLFLDRCKEGLASQLIAVYGKHRGEQIDWDTAVEITAILTGMSDEERDKLLSLDGNGNTPKDNAVTEYWMEYYCPGTVCALCGNSGIVDTTASAFAPGGHSVGGRFWCLCPNGQHRRKATDDAPPSSIEPKKVRQPDGYAYRYPTQHLDPEVQKNYPTEIRMTHGEEINGYKPVESIPYFFGTPSGIPGNPNSTRTSGDRYQCGICGRVRTQQGITHVITDDGAAVRCDPNCGSVDPGVTATKTANPAPGGWKARQLAAHWVYADEGGMAELEALIRQGKKYTDWQINIGEGAPLAWITHDGKAFGKVSDEQLVVALAEAAHEVYRRNGWAIDDIGPFVDALVKRFLSWSLPDTVSPDGFYPAGEFKRQHGTALTGTNLLNAEEAKAMILHLFAESPHKLWQSSIDRVGEPVLDPAQSPLDLKGN